MPTDVAEKNDVETVEDETAVDVKDDIAELKLDHDHLVEIKQANEKLKDAKDVMESRKTDYNEAKAIHDKFVVKLSESIDEPDMPLFDKPETGEASDDEPDLAAWARVPIQSLNLDKATEAVLMGYGLCSLGDIASFAEEGKQFGDIKGIGAAKVEKITLALDAYWAANPLPEKEAANTDDPEGWRNSSLYAIGVTLHVQGLLKTNNIETLGELCTNLKANILDDVDGIGHETITDLTDKLNDYVAEWGGKPETETPE